MNKDRAGTPPNPLESPQERCPDCGFPEVDNIPNWCLRSHIPSIYSNKPNHIDTTEPKPAPQAEGFEYWWEKYLANRTIAPFPEPWMMVNGRQAALTSWTAAQAPLLQKIAELEQSVNQLAGDVRAAVSDYGDELSKRRELEEKLKDTKKALEILATGVIEECSESLESEDLVAMAVRLAIDTARREGTGK